MKKLEKIMKEDLTKEEIEQQDKFLDKTIKALVSVAESNKERTLYTEGVYDFVEKMRNENYAMYVILKLRELGVNISFEEEGIETLNSENDLLIGYYIGLAGTVLQANFDEINNK